MLMLSVEGNTCSSKKEAGRNNGLKSGPAGLAGIYAENLIENSTTHGEKHSDGRGTSRYPLAVDALNSGDSDAPLHMRAGVGLIGELVYGVEGVEDFVPRLFGATNLPAASHTFNEKFGTGGLAGVLNRGESSIGMSDRLGFVDDKKTGGVLERLRVVGFLERAGKLIQTSGDARAADAPVWGKLLRDYLVFGIATQCAGDEAGAFDSVLDLIAAADRPSNVLIFACTAPPSIVNTSNGVANPFALCAGDICHVVTYDSEVISFNKIEETLREGRGESSLRIEGVSWLRQVVV